MSMSGKPAFFVYEKGIARESHKVEDKTFKEENLPVGSLTEYFEHFLVLKIVYTFHHLLLEKDGKPTRNFHNGINGNYLTTISKSFDPL